MDISISTLVDLTMPLEDLLEAIAAAGFDKASLSHQVEHSGYHLPGRIPELKSLLNRNGLRLNYIHAPLERYFDLCSTNRYLRWATVELMKVPLQACAELGGACVVAHPMNGPLGPGDTDEARIEAGLESIAELAEFALEQGVVLALENLPLNLDAGRVGLEVIRRATQDGVGVCIDTCHARIENPDMLELVRELAPRVVATHCSDTWGAKDTHLIPGEGCVDFPAVAELLREAGYLGALDLECSVWMLRLRHESGRLHQGDPPQADIPWISTAQYLAWSAAAARRIAGCFEPRPTVSRQQD